MDPVNVLAKFQASSFTRSWDNSDWSFGWGLQTSNLGKGGRRGSGMVPSKRALVSSYTPSIQNIRLSALVCANFRLEFGPGVANPQSWGRGGRRYGSKERQWVPLGPLLYLLLYLYAFQRHCRFCAPARHFSSPHLSSPQNFSLFPWEQVDGLWSTKSEGVGLTAVQLVSKTSSYVILIHQRYRQTDGRTDGRRDERHLIARARFPL